MDTIEAIHTRRSIRKFADGPVTEDELRTLLEAAMTAPSAGNAQPWQFVVVTERDLLDRVPDFHAYAAMCRQAPAAILVCGDPSREKYEGYWPQDCAAATQNLLLAAHAQGLGAVWTGIHPDAAREAGARELFGVPEDVVPFALVPLGRPAQPAGRKSRYDDSRVHWERW